MAKNWNQLMREVEKQGMPNQILELAGTSYMHTIQPVTKHMWFVLRFVCRFDGSEKHVPPSNVHIALQTSQTLHEYGSALGGKRERSSHGEAFHRTRSTVRRMSDAKI